MNITNMTDLCTQFVKQSFKQGFFDGFFNGVLIGIVAGITIYFWAKAIATYWENKQNGVRE